MTGRVRSESETSRYAYVEVAEGSAIAAAAVGLGAAAANEAVGEVEPEVGGLVALVAAPLGAIRRNRARRGLLREGRCVLAGLALFLPLGGQSAEFGGGVRGGEDGVDARLQRCGQVGARQMEQCHLGHEDEGVGSEHFIGAVGVEATIDVDSKARRCFSFSVSSWICCIAWAAGPLCVKVEALACALMIKLHEIGCERLHRREVQIQPAVALRRVECEPALFFVHFLPGLWCSCMSPR